MPTVRNFGCRYCRNAANLILARDAEPSVTRHHLLALFDEMQAARRAERGLNPGAAQQLIRRSISGPAAALAWIL